MESKKDLLRDYRILCKAYMNLRQELSIINGIKKDNSNSRQLKKLIN